MTKDVQKVQIKNLDPKKSASKTLECKPLTPDRWNDFTTLFGERGACEGCWCMWWRIKRAQFDKQAGEGNKQAMKAIVDSGEVPGLLAYNFENKPIAWTSVAPRTAYPVLDRSWVLKPVDDQPVWSVVCFYIEKSNRNQGLSLNLLEAAKDYARQNGAKILEGYPMDPQDKTAPDISAFVGMVSVFRKAGFVEVARRSEKRPIMRCNLE